MIPAVLKKQLSAALKDGFVLKRAVFQPCLELYPMSEWNALMAKVNKLNRFKKKNNDFIRRFTAGVKVVEVDNAGRLLIPRDLIGFSGITKEVVLASAVNIIEIWDKDKYEQAIDDAASDFAAGWDGNGEFWPHGVGDDPSGFEGVEEDCDEVACVVGGVEVCPQGGVDVSVPVCVGGVEACPQGAVEAAGWVGTVELWFGLGVPDERELMKDVGCVGDDVDDAGWGVEVSGGCWASVPAPGDTWPLGKNESVPDWDGRDGEPGDDGGSIAWTADSGFIGLMSLLLPPDCLKYWNSPGVKSANSFRFSSKPLFFAWFAASK